MSGFIMTTDAILSVVVVASLFVAMTTNLMTAKEINTEDILYEYGQDFLAVADKTGALDEILPGCEPNQTEPYPIYPCTQSFKQLLAQTPDSICMEAEVLMPNGTLFYHADNYDDKELQDKYGMRGKTGCLRGQKSDEGDDEDIRPEAFIRVSRVIVGGSDVKSITLELWRKGWK